MRKSIVAAVIAASAATASCGHERSEDAGPTISKAYQVGDFKQIEVAGSYDVEVRTGAKAGVTAQGGEKLLERTTVEVDGDKLVIRPRERHGFFNFSWGSHRGNARFVVTVPVLTGASIAGSGDVKINQVKGDSFDGQIAGSGTLTLTSVEVQSLKLGIAGSGGVKAGTGTTKSGDYEIAGSGDIDAGAINATDLKVSIAGSGNVKGNATGTANVDIAGSGDVDISGGAKCTVDKHGSGTANCS